MAVSKQELQTAQNGAIWAGKSGKTTYFIRKINGKFEVWTSGSNDHYPVTIDQAVTYGNQYNMTNKNNTSTPTPSKPSTKAAPKPKAKKNSNKANDDASTPKKPKTTQEITTTVRLPGQRLENPLGWLPSYTYQISLYMITPDAYSAFNRTGGRDIYAFKSAPSITELNTDPDLTAGAFLIAQSGGRPVEDASSFFPYDYGIDSLTIETGKPSDTGAATSTVEYSFKITEPYGFSFVSNLKRARNALDKYTDAYDKERKEKTKAANKGKKKKASSPEVALRNFFVLGIRFFGWDEEGNPVTGDTVRNGTPIDPNSDSTILFERFFPIKVSEFKSVLDGKNQVYTIKAANADAAQGFSNSIATVKNDIKIEASTVGEALDKLAENLNKQMENIKKKNNKEKYYTYAFSYKDSESQIQIGGASMISKADVDKYKWKGSGAKNSKQSNDATGLKNYKCNDGIAEFTIAKGTRILDAVDRIISQSEYITAALEVVYDTSLESSEKDDFPSLPNPNPRELQWYYCSPSVNDLEWDPDINNWVHETNFVLNTYKTPCTFTPKTKSKNVTKYYGPLKKYEYWYSGKNTGVLRYEYNYNLNFFQAVAGGEGKSGDDAGEDGAGDAPLGLGDRNDDGGDGKPGLAMAEQNSYKTNLYDPDGYANATLTILGDPDFLADPHAPTAAPLSSNPNTTIDAPTIKTVADRFYGKDGYTMNMSGGETFIEVVFFEAEDYNNEGVLVVNDSIQFWEEPAKDTRYMDSRAAEGISHGITSIRHTFQNGNFQQTLKLKASSFNNPDTVKTVREQPKKKNSRQQNTSKSNSGPTPKNSPTTTKNTGLKQEPKTLAPFKTQQDADRWRSQTKLGIFRET